MSKEIKELETMKHLEKINMNWCEEGGAVIYRVNNEFILFEVPLYGGEENYMNTYNIKYLDLLVEEMNSWT